MTTLDWIIVGLYLATTLSIGLAFSKRGGRSGAAFFVAGRKLPWWLAGTSIVATSFSADTPMQVARFARQGGVAWNWIWWSEVLGSVACVYFFARLWRRSGVTTEVEFVRLRYEPGPARTALRMFRALFDGVLVNAWVMATVSVGGAKLMGVLLGIDLSAPVFGGGGGFEITQGLAIVFGLATLAAVYSLMSGLLAVVWTDLLQFVLAMVGSIWLAVLSVRRVHEAGGWSVVKATDPADTTSSATALLPDLAHAPGLFMLTFTIWMTFGWLDRVAGRGYQVQRMLATRSERDATLAFLWFAVGQYALRSWPWIVVGLASVVVLTEADAVAALSADPDLTYPMMIDALLGPGAKGVMVAALLAAYMSTIDTHLNWGASYLVTDVARPLLAARRRRLSPRGQVTLARWTVAGLLVAVMMLAPFLGDIKHAYQTLAVILGGLVTVSILRWYWWRVSVWSELAAIVGTLVIANVVNVHMKPPDGATPLINDWHKAASLAMTVVMTTALWVAVTFMAKSKPCAKDVAFYRRIHPAGPGWRRVRAMVLESQAANQTAHQTAHQTANSSDATALSRATSHASSKLPPAGHLGRAALGWLVCSLTLYAVILGTGAAIFARWEVAGLCAAITLVGGGLVVTKLSPLKD